MTQIPKFEIHDFLARQLNNELLPGDAEQLQEWLAVDPDHEIQWNVLQRIWSERSPWVAVDQDRARTAMWATIEAQEGKGRQPGRSHRSTSGNMRKGPLSRIPWGSASLTIALCVMVLGIWQFSRGTYTSLGTPAKSAPSRVFSTAKGERASIQLVDGTQVILGAASTLRVDESFNSSERAVVVEGEAYFQVAHRSTAPFLVRAGGTQTRVLGTQFAVRAYHDDPTVQVVVTDGKVTVGALGSANQSDVTLVRNELVQMDRKSHLLTRYTVDASQYTAWIEGRFEFVSVPLQDVIRDLERWYDVDIHISDSSLAAIPVTASSSSLASVDEVLSRLSDALDVRFTRAGRIVRLSVTP